jgi:glycosyltransferase involved in cell wall biosynthesis
MSKRLGIFVTHPIQYFAPMWRKLAAQPGLSVRVHFFSDHSVRGGEDEGFQVPVAWDVPLLEGYDHSFLRRTADLSKPLSVSLADARGLLRAGQFDWVMVHGYTYRFELQVVRAARRLGVPVLQRGELTDARPYEPVWYRRLLRDSYLKWFYRQINRFCYIGANARRHLLRMGVKEDRLFFSPYSVDSSLFEEQYRRLDRETCRRELGISSEQLVLLFSGKFIARKAPLLLLDAIARLDETENLALLMLGDGVLRPEVESRARAVLGDRAFFPGFVNQTQLGRYFRAADIFVLPSIFETWGLVVNEAMHFRLPAVVSSGVGCAPDLIRNGETGRVFPIGDAKELANCLQEFLDMPDRARITGAAAGEHIRGYSTDASASGVIRAIGLNCAVGSRPTDAERLREGRTFEAR